MKLPWYFKEKELAENFLSPIRSFRPDDLKSLMDNNRPIFNVKYNQKGKKASKSRFLIIFKR